MGDERGSETRTFPLLDVVPGSRLGVLAGDERDVEHEHDAVEEAVHDLEPGRLVLHLQGRTAQRIA